MSLEATTPAAIRSVLIDKIHALTPTYTEWRDCKWSHHPDRMIAGVELRTFRIFHSIAQPAASVNTPEGAEPWFTEAIWGGSGIEFTYEMRIRTAYGGIAESDHEDLVWMDNRDLFLMLAQLPDTADDTTGGMIGFRWLNAEPVQADEGGLIIDHRFLVHFLGADR